MGRNVNEEDEEKEQGDQNWQKFREKRNALVAHGVPHVCSLGF